MLSILLITCDLDTDFDLVRVRMGSLSVGTEVEVTERGTDEYVPDFGMGGISKVGVRSFAPRATSFDLLRFVC